jgi:hypothetical protein
MNKSRQKFPAARRFYHPAVALQLTPDEEELCLVKDREILN